MKKQKNWPHVPGPFDCFGGIQRNIVEPPTGLRVGSTVCKHGKAQCEICGTTRHRDGVHSTVRGKGVVARISR